MLSFSLKSPPFIAVCIGDNYMLVFGTSGQHSHEDVGLTFPEDYGAISGFQWLEDDTVLVALSNGYITTVDFGAMVRMRKDRGLPECVKATGTTRVFENYLTCLTYNQRSGRIGVCGDSGFKVMIRKNRELECLADITLEYKLTIGNHLDSLRWSPDGSALAITATDGYVWWYNISDARPHTEVL